MNFEMWVYNLPCICHFKCLTSSITIKQYRSVYRRDEARSEDNVLLEDFYWFEFTTLCYDFTRCKKIIKRLVWWWLQQYSDAETATQWRHECHSEVYNKGITEFNEVAGQSLSIALGVEILWNYEYLLWSPSKYGNLTHLLIPEE